MKKALLTVSLLGAGLAQAQPGFGPPELTMVPVEGHPNLHLIRNQFAGNITVISGEEGVVLIDTKMATEHEGVVGFVREVTDAPIKYVINTHMHPDHVGGNVPMLDIGAVLLSSENARAVMLEQGIAGPANITMREQLRVWLDDMPIDLHYLGRGHTNGDIVIHLPTEGVIIMGDLFALWPYEAVIDYASGASLRDWPGTLDRALALDFETVIPGHSGVTDRSQIEGFRDHLLDMQAMVRDMISQNRSRADILSMMQTEFSWGGLSSQFIDGLIVEMGGSVAPAPAGGFGGRGAPGGRRGGPPPQ